MNVKQNGFGARSPTGVDTSTVMTCQRMEKPVYALLTARDEDDAKSALHRLPPLKRAEAPGRPVSAELSDDIRAPLIVLLHDRGDPEALVGGSRGVSRAPGDMAQYTETLFSIWIRSKGTAATALPGVGRARQVPPPCTEYFGERWLKDGSARHFRLSEGFCGIPDFHAGTGVRKCNRAPARPRLQGGHLHAEHDYTLSRPTSPRPAGRDAALPFFSWQNGRELTTTEPRCHCSWDEVACSPRLT